MRTLKDYLESRIAVAAVLIPILYILIRYLSPFFFFLFAAAAIARTQYEVYRLYYREKKSIPIWVGLGLGFLLSLRFYREPVWGGQSVAPFHLVFIFILMAVFIFSLFFFKDIKDALVDSAVLFLGVVYISGFLSHLILIRQIRNGGSLIIFFLIVIWVGDAGAYYVGRSIGKRKLYPTVSPNKTVEGAIGGLAGCFLGGAFSKLTFLSLFSWGELFGLALLLGVFGQIGDLAESMLKRSAGVKDSSALMFAHGGLLDKLDGVAFAAPVFYYYLYWIKGFGRFTIGF